MRRVFLGCLLFLGCGAEKEPKRIATPPPDPILVAIAELSHPSSAMRERGSAEIRARIGESVSIANVRLLLHAATRPWPSPEGPATLVRLVAAAHPDEASVADLRAAFASFGEEARAESLSMLLGIPGPVAATAFAELYPSLGPTTQVDLRRLRDAPRDPEIFFPALYARLDSSDWFEIVYTTLTYLEAGELDARHVDPIRARLLRDWRMVHSRLARGERKKGLAWVWDPDYQEPRGQGALLLDLFGYLDPEDAERPLRQALKLKDPRILLFAATSQIRLGLELSPKILNRVAAWPETRGILFDRLNGLAAIELMPERFATQSALAESDMVHWLTFPSELGCGPAQIELMLTKVDSRDGEGAWYLYRFRVDAPHPMAPNGWMAGAAGPFFDGKLASAGNSTFSHFTSWDQATPEDHLDGFRQKADPDAEEDQSEEDE